MAGKTLGIVLEEIVANYNASILVPKPGTNQELEIQLLTQKYTTTTSKTEKTVSQEEFSYFFTYFKNQLHVNDAVTETETNILDIKSSFDGGLRLTLEGREDIAAFCKNKYTPDLKWKCMKKIFVANSLQNDYEMVITHQTEEELPALTVTKTHLSNITEYRYKQRMSFEQLPFRFDLTIVKTLTGSEGGKMSKIFAKAPTYEVECEYITKDVLSVETMTETMEFLARIRHHNEVFISTRVCNAAILKLQTHFFLTKNFKNRFPGAKVTTVERKNVAYIKTHKYGVTDKTNGSRSLLYIAAQGAIFLVDMKWHITPIGIIRNPAVNNTVLDGELIIATDENTFQKTYCFYAFDILAQNNLSVETQQLGERYAMMQNVLQKLRMEPVVQEEQKEKDILQEQKTFVVEMNLRVQFVLSLKTYNMKPNAAKEIWDRRKNYPYVLDGLIFTPFDKPYHFSTPTWPTQFKWKPAEENSIDFLLQQQGTSTTYDLMVGSKSQPLTERFGQIDIPLGTIVDGLPISDNMIVECVFREGKWVVLKTRADKTEPNFITVAESVWKTITDPIEVFKFTKDEGAYYNSQISPEEEKKSQPLRTFNNAVKQMLIHNHASGKTLVDFSCGQGGDLHKWRMERVQKVLGIDLSNQNLKQLMERFLSPKSPRLDSDSDYLKQPGRVELWAGNTGRVLEGQTVSVVYPPTAAGDKEVTPGNHQTYDVGVSFFTIHYYFDQKSSLQSFFRNARDFINVGGRLIITCLDGEMVKGALDTAQMFSGASTIYGDVDGTHIYEIQKLYADNSTVLDFGMKINMFMHTISEKPIPEYLVPEHLLTQTAQEFSFKLEQKQMFGDIGDIAPKAFPFVSPDKPAGLFTMDETLDRFKVLHTYYVFTRDEATASTAASTAASTTASTAASTAASTTASTAAEKPSRKRKTQSETTTTNNTQTKPKRLRVSKKNAAAAAETS